MTVKMVVGRVAKTGFMTSGGTTGIGRGGAKGRMPSTMAGAREMCGRAPAKTLAGPFRLTIVDIHQP